MEPFSIFRTIAFGFATLMLVKYFIFLILAPFYPVKENRRKLRLEKHRKHRRLKPFRPFVSVIVPAWNEEVGITKTMRSVLNNTYQRIELIVVNDGSKDKTDMLVRDIMAKHQVSAHRLRYFYKPNEGKGHALNLGIKQARGELIFTVDADSILDRHAIANMVKYFEDPTIWAAVGNVKVASNKTLIGFLQRLEYMFGFYFKRAHAVMNAEYIFGGANAAYRRRLFEEIGLFDTSNKTEDIEMSLRTRYFGKHCAYAEDVVVYTEGASNLAGLINQRLRWKKGRFDTFLKYRSLFFSRSAQHSKWLSFFVLPFSLLAEVQLLFEPIAIALLVTYSVITGDYISLALGSLFVLVIYLVNALFSHEGIKLRYILIFPFTWPLFYILVWVEYIALMKGIRMVIRGDDIEWQQWERVGVQD
jgi:cellulose synthase/poly-beta-1,6-N-acetylglucosamine synthase-like glycosyltransferase